MLMQIQVAMVSQPTYNEFLQSVKIISKLTWRCVYLDAVSDKHKELLARNLAMIIDVRQMA